MQEAAPVTGPHPVAQVADARLPPSTQVSRPFASRVQLPAGVPVLTT